jgi:8-oxo-dGTP diphosphatase
MPGIGVGIFLANIVEDKVLIGKRKDSGLLGLPGGWLEPGEEWDECASRELSEETGLYKKPNTFKHVHTLNSKQLENRYHNISCIMYNEVTDEDIEKIKNTEPKKCSGWYWITFSEMRKQVDDLFYPLRDFLGKFPDLNNVEYLKNMIKPPRVESKLEKIESRI